MSVRSLPVVQELELLHLLLEVIPDAAIAVDGDGVVVAANEDARLMLGYRPHALVGLRVDRLVPDAVRAIHHRHRVAFAANPRRRPMGAELDLRARRADGTEFPVDIMLAPVELDGRRAVVAAIRDTTRQREAEAELREAYRQQQVVGERLRRADETKDAFLRAVSHDLANPLAAILGFAATLRSDVVKEAAQRDHMLDRIADNARRIERLVGDLRDLDRLNSGAATSERCATDVLDAARESVRQTDLGDRRVTVDGEQLFADVDPRHLGRILDNLLANAAGHTPAGTRVWVRVKRADGDVEVIVEDSGPGVPDAVKAAIFEPFATGPGSAGTGIGLSLVAKFADLGGGRAWVEDRPGGGASFHVRLPLAH